MAILRELELKQSIILIEVVKIWPLIKMMTRVQATKSPPEKSTTLKSLSRSLRQPFQSYPPSQRRPSISELPSTIPTPLPLRGSFISEIFPELKAPTPNLKLQQQIVQNLRQYLCNTFLPTFITCNASINADSYRQWQILWHAIPSTSSNDHNRYNRFNMWRSCSYKQLINYASTPTPYQVYMIFLLLGEDRFLNPHTYTIILVAPYASPSITLKGPPSQ